MRHQWIVSIWVVILLQWCCNISAAPKNKYNELLLAVTLNQRMTQQIFLVLQDKKNHLWLSRKAFKTLRIKLPSIIPIRYQSQRFYALNKIPKIKYRIDWGLSRLYLKIPHEQSLRSSWHFKKSAYLNPTLPNMPGGFFNYDFFGEKTAAIKRHVDGSFELGFFNQLGVGTLDFLEKDIGGNNRTIRLNTVWRYDNPDKMQTWELGDAFTSPGLWGEVISLGGVTWHTNFEIHPEFVKFPLPAVSGTAVMPSVADIYVNNARVGQQDVASGSFTIDNIPVITGAGDVRLVTTDLFGRQTIVNVPYYVNPNIFKKGLHDFAFSLGFIRKNYGLRSGDYGRIMAVGTDTFGMTDHVTGQWHAELLTNAQKLGLGNNILLGNYGVLTGAFAVSEAPPGFGQLALLRFDHQGLRWNYGASTTWMSPRFYQLKHGVNILPNIHDDQVYIGLPLPGSNTIDVSYIAQYRRHQTVARLATFSYSKILWRQLFLSLSGMTNIGGEKNKAVFLSVNWALTDRTDLTIDGNKQRQWHQTIFGLQRNLQSDTGYGYRLSKAVGSNRYFHGELNLQNRVGNYSARVADEAGRIGYQGEIAGGLALFNHDIYASRTIRNSFAVVQTPGLSNIPVYLENHLVANTDKNGNVLLPGLGAYEENHISIKPAELPMQATLKASQFKVVPYYRSGVFLRLPVSVARDATLKVKLPTGKPVPVGAVANIKGRKATFLVGDDGRLYLSDLSDKNTVVVSWGSHQCEFKLPYQLTTNVMPNLGTFICKEHGS